MIQVIPLQATASQIVACNLGGQACQINVYQKSTGLYLDLYVSDVLIIGGVLCQNYNLIVRNSYLGFVGDLAFYDTQGTQDPTYTGIGLRFFLYYLAPGSGE